MSAKREHVTMQTPRKSLDGAVRMAKLSGRSVHAPRGCCHFEAHQCFQEPNAHRFLAVNWVEPIVWPMQHTGYLSRAPWHGLEELMDSMPETIFREFIKRFAAHTRVQ
ncbi:hypothetical protein WJX79_008410 [Trebouxia sp. C0005]